MAAFAVGGCGRNEPAPLPPVEQPEAQPESIFENAPQNLLSNPAETVSSEQVNALISQTQQSRERLHEMNRDIRLQEMERRLRDVESREATERMLRATEESQRLVEQERARRESLYR